MSTDGFHELTIRNVIPIGPDLVQATIATTGTPLEAVQHKPGQYVRMAAGEEKPSYFAIASGPGEKGQFVFVLKRGSAVVDRIVAGGNGSKVRCSGPEGNGYPMDKLTPSDNLWLLAMGTGITPIRPVIEYLLANPGRVKEIHLYFGCRDRGVIPFAADLKRWEEAGVKVRLVISSEMKIHVQQQFAKDHPKASGIVFACGNKEMIAGVKAAADACGIGAANVFQNF